ncbi:hypothetical protein FB451DRAFT_1286503 [Mycena latifolia]|nr:hypothetical protein FB451DRAFT_1286503 [Mycena latifolia]
MAFLSRGFVVSTTLDASWTSSCDSSNVLVRKLVVLPTCCTTPRPAIPWMLGTEFASGALAQYFFVWQLVCVATSCVTMLHLAPLAHCCFESTRDRNSSEVPFVLALLLCFIAPGTTRYLYNKERALISISQLPPFAGIVLFAQTTS